MILAIYESIILFIQVRHSQRFKETPLSCWIIIEKTGEICCAHCNCMAGLGETCTHIAATLFYLEAASRLQGKQTSTQRKCEWILPSFQKDVEYLPIKEIDFTSAIGKKRKLDELIDSSVSENQVSVAPQQALPLPAKLSPTAENYDSFYEQLSETDTKPAILSLIPKYSSAYIPKQLLPIFPQPLESLHDPKFMKLDYLELLKVCELQKIEITTSMAQAVEKETRLQSGSKLWFCYRAGRVTASRMKAVCRTDHSNPSQSLVKSISYPESFCFTSKQTAWGCKHEKSARDEYMKVTREQHTKFAVQDSGLVINPKWPFIGASPDGIVSCQCCGKGTLELKCPFCHKGETIEDAVSLDKNFCLKSTANGKYELDVTHTYYYQVQTQLFVLDVDYCDFCVCTFCGNSHGIYIERISRNSEFWDDCVAKASYFFTFCILPELLGKWYTRPYVKHDCPEESSSSSSTAAIETDSIHSSSHDRDYCYCGGTGGGLMIGCDNDGCAIEWFHMECLRIMTVPKGKWYCPDCRKLPKHIRLQVSVNEV